MIIKLFWLLAGIGTVWSGIYTLAYFTVGLISNSYAKSGIWYILMGVLTVSCYKLERALYDISLEKASS